MSQLVQPRSPALARLSLVLVVVACCAALALHGEEEATPEALDQEIAPLAPLSGPCAVRGEDARLHARTLEQMAAARWERVPFSLEEAPRAALQMAEAEACYLAAQDRPGRLRAGSLRAAYFAEVQRRFERARLLLRVALREERSERARAQIATLLSLLASAPEQARGYRTELEQLGRRYAAYAHERAAGEESTP